MIAIEELWKMIDESLASLEGVEVAMENAPGCVTAEAVVAPFPIPPFDASSMDGFAFAETMPGECGVVGEVAAGDSEPGRVQPGEAIRIFTGAKVSEGAVCVAKQEDCLVDKDEGKVRLREGIALAEGENIRFQGRVAQSGDALIKAGRVLTAGSVGLLASCGIATVRGIRPPEVLHIATGSELLAPGEPPAPGKIHDSNGPMIEALLGEQGIRSLRRVRLRDSLDDLRTTIAEFEGDLLLISGGSGPGDHDHTPAALRECGFEIHASRINSRPGKPLIFATRGNRAAFGLPGNPLSHWVCFHAFVLRALTRLRGLPPQPLLPLPLLEPINDAGDGRPTWTPASLEIREGALAVRPLPWKHSGDLTCLAAADALILDGKLTMLPAPQRFER